MRGRYVFFLGMLGFIGGYIGARAFSAESVAEAQTQQGKPTQAALVNRAPATSHSFDAGKATSLTLSRENTIVFRGEVTPLSVAKTQSEVLEKDAKLPKGAPIYMFLETPGGDIGSGNQLISTIKATGRPVHTVSLFAASMGFNIVQRLDTRYVLSSGTLMAHRATVGGLEGQIPGNFLTRVANILSTVTGMEKQNAARLGISFEEYTTLVKDEYWVTGEEAVKQNAADKVAQIKCDSSLGGKHEEEYATFFGPAFVTFADCPAVTGPLSVRFGKEGPGDIYISQHMTNQVDMWKLLSGDRP
jgi:ATP-dependent Clp protease protease subunit